MQIFFTCSPNIIYSYRSSQSQKSIYLLPFFQKYSNTYSNIFVHLHFSVYSSFVFFFFFTHAGLMINSYSTYDLILLPFFLESLPDYLHFQPFPFSFSPPTFISVSLFVTVPTPFQLQLPISPLSLSRCNDDIIMKHISQ